MSLRKQAFGNILGKGENAGSQHLLLLPKCFLMSINSLLYGALYNYSVTDNLLDCTAFALDSLSCRICCATFGSKRSSLSRFPPPLRRISRSLEDSLISSEVNNDTNQSKGYEHCLRL